LTHQQPSFPMITDTATDPVMATTTDRYNSR